MPQAPIRIAGDAANLPFADGSLRLVLAFQTLSQFALMETVFLEVKRVLAPGGIFLFGEEPLKRLLTLGLYRCPYYDTMKPWERRLSNAGLLGYFVRDVIGARQEESFGIRQNHTMALKDWDRLIHKHFERAQYEMFVPERGWGERILKRAAVAADPYRSVWRAARLLGGTLAAVCRKAGDSETVPFDPAKFEAHLRCPDCRSPLLRGPLDALCCASCSYQAGNEGGVYNLLPSAEKAELYPGDRGDIVDFSLPGHEARLLGAWYELEGVFGNKYRWIGRHASARLAPIKPGPQRLRVRGHASPRHPVELRVLVNENEAARCKLDRPGLFLVEAALPPASEYRVTIQASPPWRAPGDARDLTVSLSMIRLVPAD